jgi:C-8 sterol isomerase
MPVFSPQVVHECAMECLGHPKPEMFDVFAHAMEKRYPGKIDFSKPWIYSIAGGAMIQMTLYYASLTEYIMIWGTPIGSEGHSGRHFSGFWDTVIDGEMWYYGEGEFEKKIYTPGSRVYVGPGQARAMNFTDGVWAVEYARGFLPFSMPFGTISEFLICGDLIAAFQTFSLYTDLVAKALGQKIWILKPLTWVISKVSHAITMALTPSPEVSVIPEKNIHWFQRKT